MKGFPNFSAEENFSEKRALPDDLLNNSEEFIRLFEKHQPELQQVLNDLKKSSDEFLDKYGTAVKDSKSGGEHLVIGASVGAGVGTALAVLFLGPAAIAAAGILGAAPGASKSYRGNKNKQEEEKKVKTELKNALNKFHKTTDTVANRLKNICNDVEKILH
ncbi:hypothetical protein AMEX_G4591 [Astyanax mexicanus]|uniref:Uncharacterized protein n=1 Tax=Astyanax mexicanus TaxID=7994 RepID=A0A8T2M4Y4_ASTMX|nr:hypothetical protein AMEX_G4591 [Astyanax mexicanus]